MTVDTIALTDTLLDADGGALSLTTAPAFSGTTKGGEAGPNTANEGTLVPGEVASYTATYVIEQQAIDAGGVSNTAIAAGKDPSDNDVSDDSDNGDETADDDGDNDPTKDPTKTPIAPDAELTVVKTASAADGTDLGDTITYTITVENTGNVTVDTIALTDALTDADGESLDLSTAPAFSGTTKAGEAGPNTANEGTLVPGETATYTATYAIEQQAIDAGGVSNTVIATGKDPSDNDVSDAVSYTHLTLPTIYSV